MSRRHVWREQPSGFCESFVHRSLFRSHYDAACLISCSPVEAFRAVGFPWLSRARGFFEGEEAERVQSIYWKERIGGDGLLFYLAEGLSVIKAAGWGGDRSAHMWISMKIRSVVKVTDGTVFDQTSLFLIRRLYLGLLLGLFYVCGLRSMH